MPFPLELATSLDNLSRHRFIGFGDGGQFRTHRPQIAKLARGFVLINQPEVPAQQHGRQWQSAQKAFERSPRGALTFEQPQPPQRRLKLRVETAEQFRLHRRKVTLLCGPHNYDDGEEPLALPKEQADGMGSLLGRHVFPIEIRSQHRAARGKDITVADKSAAAWMLDQIGLDRLGIEGAIRNRSRPFGDERGNRMVLQGQTDQGTGHDCLDQVLHRRPERLNAGSSMQTEQWLFDGRAEYRLRGGALHVNSFSSIYDRATSSPFSPS